MVIVNQSRGSAPTAAIGGKSSRANHNRNNLACMALPRLDWTIRYPLLALERGRSDPASKGIACATITQIDLIRPIAFATGDTRRRCAVGWVTLVVDKEHDVRS